MKLLITTTVYNSESSLPSITDNQESVTVNSIGGIYCDLTDVTAFNNLQLDSDDYAMSDGNILIPKTML